MHDLNIFLTTDLTEKTGKAIARAWRVDAFIVRILSMWLSAYSRCWGEAIRKFRLQSSFSIAWSHWFLLPTILVPLSVGYTFQDSHWRPETIGTHPVNADVFYHTHTHAMPFLLSKWHVFRSWLNPVLFPFPSSHVSGWILVHTYIWAASTDNYVFPHQVTNFHLPT